MLDNIVDGRKSLEVEALKKIEREDKCLADQRAFELEKLKLQAQNPPASVVVLVPTNSIPSEIPLHSNTVDEAETNDLHLREEEGQALNVEEKEMI
ncbi:hypothetical protein TNCV_3023151 [Trichonephila clavipes]|uniref:Uncharacterized protein n=1 Tax=Trichonephila clavipes TaxID=2585209 RepID=A0A8X6RUZ9_TRICX|nr:hypothetical protein TNCV_3023151 [Trichonephila clavipes]